MNGDSAEVVKLLSEKIDTNGKQFNQRIDDLQKYMDDQYGNLDNKITRETGNNKKLLDLHCPRIRKLEEKQAIIITKLAIFISGVIFTGIFLLDNFVDWLKHLLTK